MKSLSLQQPHAIVMLGIPGSGKTFFAEKFASTFGAPLINIDEILPLASSEKAAYALAEHQITELLKTNHSIVIEIDTATRQSRTYLSQKFKKSGYKTLFIWVQTDIDTAMARTNKQKDIPFETYRSHIERFTPPVAGENVLVISGKHTYASQVRVVLKKLSSAHTEQAVTTSVRPPARGQIIIR
ncbi:MAG: AAA family ATPase [Candidatus Saccharimonadales bacterium]